MSGSLAECTLDLVGLDAQRERYRRLGESAIGVERRGEELAIRFDATLDRGLLAEAVAVESECCPFFRFDYSAEERLLHVGVAEPGQLPALEAIAYAFGGATAPA